MQSCISQIFFGLIVNAREFRCLNVFFWLYFRNFGESLLQLLCNLGLVHRVNTWVLSVLNVETARASYLVHGGRIPIQPCFLWPTNGLQLNIGNSCARALQQRGSPAGLLSGGSAARRFKRVSHSLPLLPLVLSFLFLTTCPLGPVVSRRAPHRQGRANVPLSDSPPGRLCPDALGRVPESGPSGLTEQARVACRRGIGGDCQVTGGLCCTNVKGWQARRQHCAAGGQRT